ncbi:AAA family ATPase [Methylobacterium indicum]|uniref:AAA family ATPase n=1 Tax=Methylobacterium indicum TaxID=1775910 RepID=UPI002435BC0E|nr:AAA family ATPase [Methylobacterium indicum]
MKIIQPIRINFPEKKEISDHNFDSHISVLLGRNGQGKSRLLSAIAASFQLLQTYNRSRSLRRLPLRHLAYEFDGVRYEVVSEPGGIANVHVDGIGKNLSDIKLPSRVIALSMTPFDKFPIGSVSRQLDLFEDERPDIYSYLGMRDRMGRASVSALLFRAVEGLFFRHNWEDRARIVKVFNMIGYEESINVVFRIESSSSLRELSDGRYLDDNVSGSTFVRDRVSGIIKTDPDKAERLFKAANDLKELVRGGFIVLNLDIRAPSTASTKTFTQLQLLRQAGLARLYAVEAKKTNGDIIDFKQASSGELSVAISFMSLAASLSDNSLVLIDEPETNLHPEWQAKYIDLIMSTFSGFHGCQYILATHSPLILSDAPASATLASVSDDVPAQGSEVSGQSVDYLLAKAFQTVGGANYYLQEQVVKALRLAADGELESPQFSSILSELRQLRPLIRDNPGIIQIIIDLEGIALRRGSGK